MKQSYLRPPRRGPNPLRAIWSIATNDLSIWLRRPVVIFSTLVPSIMYVLVIYFISVTVGNPPVALVNEDTGPQGARLQEIMANSGDFSLFVMPADEARARLASMKVAAIITIPQTFEGQAATQSVSIKMNNVNQDIQDDLRRSFAASLSLFNQDRAAGALPVLAKEQDTYAKDITLAQYRIVPGLVLIMTIAGVVNAGLAMCQEFERRTMKDLSLAPMPRHYLVLGKIIGGWLTTLVVGTVLIAVAVAAGLLHTKPLYWLPMLGMAALVGFCGSAVGTATGAIVRKYQLVTSISVAISLYLFFLSGGISVYGFLPHLMQSACRYVPLYYGIQALEQVVFDASLANYLRDTLIMLAFGLGAILVATRAVRRPLTR